ncbi:MAG: hypothetical protein WC634_01485 [archaeon]
MEIIKIDESNREAILDLFSKSIDNEGYITEKKTGKKLVCPYSNKHIKIADFSVIPGTATFVNNHYYCFSEHLAKHR